MGQSRHNPMSTQYKGADKPKAILGTDIRVVFEPNVTMKAHLEEMKVGLQHLPRELKGCLVQLSSSVFQPLLGS